MKYVGWIVALVTLAGTVASCDRDPYMARKGGYTPGSYSRSADRSTAYASQSDYYRNDRDIRPGSQM